MVNLAPVQSPGEVALACLLRPHWSPVQAQQWLWLLRNILNGLYNNHWADVGRAEVCCKGADGVADYPGKATMSWWVHFHYCLATHGMRHQTGWKTPFKEPKWMLAQGQHLYRNTVNSASLWLHNGWGFLLLNLLMRKREYASKQNSRLWKHSWEIIELSIFSAKSSGPH